LKVSFMRDTQFTIRSWSCPETLQSRALGANRIPAGGLCGAYFGSMNVW